MSINGINKNNFISKVDQFSSDNNLNANEKKIITLFVNGICNEEKGPYCIRNCRTDDGQKCYRLAGEDDENFMVCASISHKDYQETCSSYDGTTYSKKYLEFASSQQNYPSNSETNCWHYSIQTWNCIEIKFLDFLKKHDIASASQDYKGTMYSTRFILDEKHSNTLRALKFSRYFKEFIPSKQELDYPIGGKIQFPHLLELAKTNRYTDCTIKFEDSTIWGGNQCVLAAHSKVFDKMFSSSLKEGAPNPVVDLSDADSKTAQVFISYLYTSDNPFDSNTDLNMDDLLSLSYMYEIEQLFECCVTYLNKDFAKGEFSDSDLETIEQWGTIYKNEHLLKTYQYHCWNRGMLISEKTKELFSELNIALYQPEATKVVVPNDVGYRNAIGIRYQDPNLDPSQPEPFINFSWKITQYFTWTQEGWIGFAPNQLPFKFVKILPNKEVIWESRKGNRLMEYPKTRPETFIKITDISFS